MPIVPLPCETWSLLRSEKTGGHFHPPMPLGKSCEGTRATSSQQTPRKNTEEALFYSLPFRPECAFLRIRKIRNPLFIGYRKCSESLQIGKRGGEPRLLLLGGELFPKWKELPSSLLMAGRPEGGSQQGDACPHDASQCASGGQESGSVLSGASVSALW
jgi:hypothetical protein